MAATMYRCRKCNTFAPVETYPVDTKGPDGHSRYCTPCRRVIARDTARRRRLGLHRGEDLPPLAQRLTVGLYRLPGRTVHTENFHAVDEPAPPMPSRVPTLATLVEDLDRLGVNWRRADEERLHGAYREAA